jgi:hypothetical protein
MVATTSGVAWDRAPVQRGAPLPDRDSERQPGDQDSKHDQQRWGKFTLVDRDEAAVERVVSAMEADAKPKPCQ